mmetsp:Transcript_695/g.2517  ORF Transcript_695/g.2517 Transcript_695/m.2517 type:complete len:575 (+) Transcript_695:848-2572(+)
MSEGSSTRTRVLAGAAVGAVALAVGYAYYRRSTRARLVPVGAHAAAKKPASAASERASSASAAAATAAAPSAAPARAATAAQAAPLPAVKKKKKQGEAVWGPLAETKRKEGAAAAAAEKCAECGKRGSAAGVELKTCSGCKLVAYCGVECQRTAWSRKAEPGQPRGHKAECKAARSLAKLEPRLEAFKDLVAAVQDAETRADRLKVAEKLKHDGELLLQAYAELGNEALDVVSAMLNQLASAALLLGGDGPGLGFQPNEHATLGLTAALKMDEPEVHPAKRKDASPVWFKLSATEWEASRRYLAGQALALLGAGHLRAGELEAAEMRLNEAFEALERVGPPGDAHELMYTKRVEVAMQLGRDADVVGKRAGEYEKAARRSDVSRAFFVEALRKLAWLHARAANRERGVAKAEALSRECVKLADKAQEPGEALEALRNLVNVLKEVGKGQDAARVTEELLDRIRLCGRDVESECCICLTSLQLSEAAAGEQPFNIDVLQCYHTFHQSCLREYFNAASKSGTSSAVEVDEEPMAQAPGALAALGTARFACPTCKACTRATVSVDAVTNGPVAPPPA